MMICHYFSFLIDEIWLDWWNNILLIISIFCIDGIKPDLRDMGLLNHPGPAFGISRAGPSS